MTGHSLGGSLALLLALDIAVNHIEQIEDFQFENENENEEENEIEKDVRKKTSYTVKKSDDILKEKKSSGNGLKTEEKELTEDDNHKKKVTQKTLVKKKIKNHKKRKLEEKKKTRQKDLYCGSYSHHRGRRCTGIADSKILNNLYVITFGQPELADNSFFKSVKEHSSAAESLLNDRYERETNFTHQTILVLAENFCNPTYFVNLCQSFSISYF